LIIKAFILSVLFLQGDFKQYEMISFSNKFVFYTSGVALLGGCLTPIDLTGFSIGFIAFVMGWVVLGLAIHTRKQLNPAKGKPSRKPGAKRAAPPKKAPKAGWA
jgi:hypothetical protein